MNYLWLYKYSHGVLPIARASAADADWVRTLVRRRGARGKTGL